MLTFRIIEQIGSVCLIIFEFHHPSVKISRQEALETCVSVGWEALLQNEDPIESMVQAGMESNWNSGATDGRSIGPMQIIPEFFCPDKKSRGCNLIAAGMLARKKWRAVAKSKKKPLDMMCFYNRGYGHNGNGCGYRDYVKKITRRVRAYSSERHKETQEI